MRTLLALPTLLSAFCGEPTSPFHGMARYEYVGAAELEKRGYEDDHLRYRVGEAEAGMVVYHNPCFREGLDISLSYLYTTMKWDYNPFFHQDYYNTVATRLSFVTSRLYRWEWRTFVKMFIEADHPDFQHYMFWDFCLWGIYDLCRSTHFHVGLYGESGMKADHVFPIIGFDWRYSDCIKVNLVFPMDLSVLYEINEHWNIGIAERFLRARHKAGKDNPVPMALWEYSSTGTELGVNYRLGDRIVANAHAGYAWDGKIRVSNRSRKNAKHFDIAGAPYVGAAVSMHY